MLIKYYISLNRNTIQYLPEEHSRRIYTKVVRMFTKQWRLQWNRYFCLTMKTLHQSYLKVFLSFSGCSTTMVVMDVCNI